MGIVQYLQAMLFVLENGLLAESKTSYFPDCEAPLLAVQLLGCVI